MKSNWIPPQKIDGEIIDQLLSNRGVDSKSRKSFLKPDFQADLHDGSLLPDFDKFAFRIKQAVENSERIGIFADYDADGIPGAAFLHKCMKRLRLESLFYIPSREEGYGLSGKGIDYLVESGCTLIITVDLGIRNIVEADYCRNKKIDLIITDHHTPGEKLPEAYAVVNPKIEGSEYPFEELSGAGVVFKLMCGLSKLFPAIDQTFLKWNLDLIAISTISDVVPLLDENRVIAKYGLIVLRKTKNIGLQQLYKAAGIDAASIGAYQVGFGIGPRINAPGRIAGANKSFILLTTEDVNEAASIAENLNEENTLRQELMDKLITEADNIIQREKIADEPILILRGEWPRGIIGPSASRIAEKYYRPVIVLTESEGQMTGSARSTGEINILELLETCRDRLEKLGGHKGAAGLSLKSEEYHNFYEELLRNAKKIIRKDNLEKKIRPELELSFGDISTNLVKDLSELEPFGMGNARPIFLTKIAKIRDPKFVGKKNNHLSSYIEHENSKIKSIYFNCPYGKENISDSTEIDLVYTVDEETWNGRNYIKMNIVDMDLCDKAKR